MEMEWADNQEGWLSNEVVIAMVPDELLQLRFAISIAQAHGHTQPIFEDFLKATDNHP